MSYTNGLDKPTDYFNTVLYTGNGSSQTITGVGFQADFIWFKERSSAGEHKLNNSVLGNLLYLVSNSTAGDDTTGSGIQSYNSDGYAVGDASNINDNTETYVTWNWLAGGSASSNSDGSITSSVSANTTSGFSIVSYTGNGTAGATVGHGLGSALDMYIIKRRSATEHWQVYHSGNTSAPETDYLQLSTNEATVDATTRWNDTAPTSSVFSVGNHASVNGSSDTYIAYCFAEKKGFSRFGSYVGNGSSDGSYIHLGFKPAFVMVKRTDSANSWIIMDNKRTTFNPMGEELKAEVSDAGNDATRWDQLSNGFKLRNAGGAVNASGGSYIYMCFSENPFVTSTGIPTTAR